MVYKRINNLRKKVILIEKIFRGFIKNKKFILLKYKSIKIQNFIRGCLKRKNFQYYKSKVIYIQKKYKERFQKLIHNSIIIQKIFRGQIINKQINNIKKKSNNNSKNI